MAGPLGTTVFQVPKLGETGFKIDQLNEQKRRQAQQQLEKEVAATGAEKAYMDNAMGLTGKYKKYADLGFQAFQQAAIEYEKTGSSAAEARMKQAASQLNYVVSGGMSILGNAKQVYEKNRANGFKDVVLSPTESSNLYTGFIYDDADAFLKDGIIMTKDGDAVVPAVNSTHLQQNSINLNNSFFLPPIVKQGTYVNTSAFVDEYKGAISAATSVADAKYRVESVLDNKFQDEDDRSMISDAITSYGINKLRMTKDPQKIDADTYEKIQNLSSDERIMSDALEWYKQEVLNEVEVLYKATSTRAGGLSIGTGTSKDLMFIEDVNISTSPLVKQGDKYTLDKSQETEEIVFDSYAGFQSNLQSKSRTDAKEFKYDIVGVGVKDGKLYADKQSSEQEKGFFANNGRIYKRKAEPMTLDELSGLPTETQALLFSYLGGKEKVESMVRGKSVTSQENNKSDDSEQKLRETLKSQGFSDEDIESIVSGN